MISIDDSAVGISPEVLDAAGGFGWWYIDWIGPDDTSVVVIASFGLPFLPGHAGAARKGDPVRPREAPSLNVVVQRGKDAPFYLLQRYSPNEGGWTEDGMRLGDSRIQSELVDGRRRFSAVLDCPLPGTTDRLTGRVVLDAAGLRLREGAEPGPHRWSPLGVGPATVDLKVGGRDLVSGEGRAYHDRNGCDRPLHDLGIAHWIWGRAPFEDGDLVYYVLWPEDGGPPRVIASHLGLDGQTRPMSATVALEGTRLGVFGMPWYSRLRLRLDGGGEVVVRSDAVIDDGPFYLRFHTTVVDAQGRRAAGVAEAVRPARVDGPLMRPLVQMAVHDVGGTNSMWLPLFAGERAGRVGRLFPGMAGPLLGEGAP